jgi:hypothetical protein
MPIVSMICFDTPPKSSLSSRPMVAFYSSAMPSIKRSGRARGHETILLVEDSAPVRRLVQRILEKAGYSALEDRTGAQGQ